MIVFIKEIEPMCEFQGGSFCCTKCGINSEEHLGLFLTNEILLFLDH